MAIVQANDADVAQELEFEDHNLRMIEQQVTNALLVNILDNAGLSSR